MQDSKPESIVIESLRYHYQIRWPAARGKYSHLYGWQDGRIPHYIIDQHAVPPSNLYRQRKYRQNTLRVSFAVVNIVVEQSRDST